MRWNAWHVFAAMALAGMLQVGALAGDGTEVAALRAEIDALRSEMNTGMATGYDQDKKPAPAPAAASAGGDCGGCGTCCGSSCGCCGTSCGCCESSCGCCGTSCGCCESSCCQSCGDCCCCCQGGWLFDAELTFLRFHREEDFNDPDVFDFEISPRFTLGYVGSNCLGTRVSYWTYDHTNVVNGDVFAVDTWNLDFEGFTVTPLSCRTSVEWSAGIRYNDYQHDLDGDNETFSGYGALVGVKVVHCVTGNISVYARAKWAILMDDGFDDGNVQFDTVRTHEELAAGAIYSTCLCNGMVFGLFGGYEFTDWTSYEDGDESVGFGGYNVGTSLRY